MPSPGGGYNVRQIALNGSAGAWVEIDAVIVSRYAEAIEDYDATAGNVQGLQYQLPTVVDGVVSWPGPTIAIPASAEPAQFGDKKYLYTHSGPILAQPGQPLIGLAQTNAMPICRIKSASATATTINFTEYQ